MDYDRDKSDAEAQIDLLTDQAEAEADFARETLETEMEDALGQLHTAEDPLSGFWRGKLGDFGPEPEEGYETYDDWYAAQEVEYEDAVADGYAGSLDDYIRSQQLTELGEYGVERAGLEEAVRNREEQIRIAGERLEFQYGQGILQHEAGVTRSNRVARSEIAQAASSGFRGGTVEATRLENLRVRNEALQMYLDSVEHQRSTGEAQLTNAATNLGNEMDINLAALAQAMQSAQSSYDLGMAGIDLGLDQYTEALEFEFDLNFGIDDAAFAVLTGGLAGAQAGLGLISAGISAGAINFDVAGQAITFGGFDFGSSPTGSFDFAIPGVGYG